MTETDWLQILLRITPQAPLDLDAAVLGSTQAGGASLPPILTPVPPVVSSRLWLREPPEQAYIGLRVTRPLADCPALAVRLASIAIERGVCPVILTTLPVSGFETYGFRIERLSEAPEEQARQEAELTAFWALALIVDAEDIALLN